MNLAFWGFALASSIVWYCLAGWPRPLEAVLAVGVILSGWWLLVDILGHPRPLPFRHGWVWLRGITGFLLLHVVPDMLRSTWLVFREVWRRDPRLTPAIVAVTLPEATLPGLAMVAYGIALTPGQQIVEIDEAQRTLYVHALEVPDPQALRTYVQCLHDEYLKEATRW